MRKLPGSRAPCEQRREELHELQALLRHLAQTVDEFLAVMLYIPPRLSCAKGREHLSDICDAESVLCQNFAQVSEARTSAGRASFSRMRAWQAKRNWRNSNSAIPPRSSTDCRVSRQVAFRICATSSPGALPPAHHQHRDYPTDYY